MIGLPVLGIAMTALMFSLGFGYIICFLAKKADAGMRGLGHIVGMIIMGLSSALILFTIYSGIKMYAVTGGMISCPMTKMDMMRPGMMHKGMMGQGQGQGMMMPKQAPSPEK